jgi:hypothetical protein
MNAKIIDRNMTEYMIHIQKDYRLLEPQETVGHGDLCYNSKIDGSFIPSKNSLLRGKDIKFLNKYYPYLIMYRKKEKKTFRKII